MPRRKAEVLDQPWVDPTAKAHRIAQGPFGAATPAMRAAVPRVKLKLATSNQKPIDKGLIGHPSPRLVVSNGLPDVDWN